jgi:hypothetical protein
MKVIDKMKNISSQEFQYYFQLLGKSPHESNSLEKIARIWRERRIDQVS